MGCYTPINEQMSHQAIRNVTKLCLMDFARFVILDSDLAVIEINEKTDDPSAFSKVIQKNRH